MKILSMLALFCCLVLCFFSLAAVAPAPSFDDDEETYKQHCGECHGVKVADIAPTTKKDKDKGPDLTGIGEKFEADWIMKYIKKEADKEGKSHKKKFKGSDEELQVLVDWLLEQKAEDYDE